MSRQTAVEAWSAELALAGHYVEPQVALSLAFWWDDRRAPSSSKDLRAAARRVSC